MFDLRDNVSRIGDEIASLSDDLAKRARPYGKELVERARPYADSLVSRARPYADSLQSRAEDIIRRVRPQPTPLEESRSFLSGPAGQIAGAAALGLVAGLALSAARKAAVQGTEALAGDWLEVLKAEHRAVDKLFEALLATTERQKVRRTLLLSRIGHALAKHSAQEELVIYPALKESAGDGQAMHLYEDHARVKIFIHELHEIAKDDPLWIERARAFHQALKAHVREEEEEIFPLYHSRMSPQQNGRLTLLVHKEGLKMA